MLKWICKKCGYTEFGWANTLKTCPNCGVRMVRKNNLFSEEEEEQDHYSFWSYNPMRWGFKDWTWGPFGKRRR